MKSLYVYLFSLFMIIGCSKSEEVKPQPEPNTPVELETLVPDAANRKLIVLSGRALHLNNEQIKDHGFIMLADTQNQFLENKISLGKTIQVGKITKKIDPSKELIAIGSFTYKFYVETNLGTYYGEPIRVTLSSIFIDYQSDLQGTVGEKITVNGDFAKITDGYILYSNYNDPKEIKYVISSNKNSIQFEIPSGYNHGTKLSIYFRPKAGNTAIDHDLNIAEVKILGTLEPPTHYEFYLNDYLRLSGPSATSGPFDKMYIIIGDKLVPYFYELALFDLIYEQPRSSYRIGYFNGRDTVIFPEKIRFKTPRPEDVQLRQAFVHPGGTMAATGLDMTRFYHMSVATVGNKEAYYNAHWTGNDQIQIGDVPDGSYPLIINSPFFNYTSKEKIQVQSLKPKSLSLSKGYYGQKITIYGNFINKERYFIQLGNYQYSESIAEAGSVTFDIPGVAPGKHPITLSYQDMNSKTYSVKSALTIEVLAPTFESFSPKSGKPGDIITLKGKGIGYGRILLGGEYVDVIGGNADAPQISIPNRFIYKGKAHFDVQFDHEWIQSKETFEIL
ncbi:IPT/TIG domain-containing protein [Sphingobacterium anhuiense]|uniref:IPT/TIG domain-containing protein n=1 Tax=Sphingobacterium anhuiense TaxID=493780 RepID=A0ABW5YPZ6_9SPHI